MIRISQGCDTNVHVKQLQSASFLGIVSSSLYMIAGSIIISDSKVIGYKSVEDNYPVTELMYGSLNSIFDNESRARSGLHSLSIQNQYQQSKHLMCMATVLIIMSAVQFAADLVLFLLSVFKMIPWRELWILLFLGIILWTMTLISFTAIFSGGGIFLLIVFILGTSIRSFVSFCIYQSVQDTNNDFIEEK